MATPHSVPEPPVENDGANPSTAFALGLLVKVVLGVLVGIAAVDVLTGVFGAPSGAQGNQSVMRLDPELGWTHRAGYADERVTIDALGLRGPGIPADAPPTEVRIVVTGASNAFGLFEKDADTWAPKLEALLAGTEPPPRALNAGVQGYSIVQACRRAARLVDRVDPDLVIVELFPSRQALVDTSPAKAWTRVNGRLAPTDLVAAWPEALRPLPAALHRLMLHSNLYKRYRAKTQLAKGVGPALAEFILTDAEAPEALRAPLEATRREMAALVAFCAEREVELRFALTVETRGANAEQWKAWLENGAKSGAPALGTPMTEPFDALARLVESAGGIAWDMRETLFTLASDWQANVNDRLHWSANGHTLIAEDWARRIQADGLLDTLVRRREQRPRANATAPEAPAPGAVPR